MFVQLLSPVLAHHGRHAVIVHRLGTPHRPFAATG
jgi:hypothetical protein